MKSATKSTPPPWASPRRSFVQHRVRNFGLTMVVMGFSFGLYYLGFFGGVEGPLQPEHIGDRLAAMGFSGRHLLYLFVLLTVVAVTWNWLYNAMGRLFKRDCRLVRKGNFAHFIWIMFLVFSLIVFFHLP